MLGTVTCHWVQSSELLGREGHRGREPHLRAMYLVPDTDCLWYVHDLIPHSILGSVCVENTIIIPSLQMRKQRLREVM